MTGERPSAFWSRAGSRVWWALTNRRAWEHGQARGAWPRRPAGKPHQGLFHVDLRGQGGMRGTSCCTFRHAGTNMTSSKGVPHP